MQQPSGGVCIYEPASLSSDGGDTDTAPSPFGRPLPGPWAAPARLPHWLCLCSQLWVTTIIR